MTEWRGRYYATTIDKLSACNDFFDRDKLRKYIVMPEVVDDDDTN